MSVLLEGDTLIRSFNNVTSRGEGKVMRKLRKYQTHSCGFFVPMIGKHHPLVNLNH